MKKSEVVWTSIDRVMAENVFGRRENSAPTEVRTRYLGWWVIACYGLGHMVLGFRLSVVVPWDYPSLVLTQVVRALAPTTRGTGFDSSQVRVLALFFASSKHVFGHNSVHTCPNDLGFFSEVFSWCPVPSLKISRGSAKWLPRCDTETLLRTRKTTECHNSGPTEPDPLKISGVVEGD